MVPRQGWESPSGTIDSRVIRLPKLISYSSPNRPSSICSSSDLCTIMDARYSWIDQKSLRLFSSVAVKYRAFFKCWQWLPQPKQLNRMDWNEMMVWVWDSKKNRNRIIPRQIFNTRRYCRIEKFMVCPSILAQNSRVDSLYWFYSYVHQASFRLSHLMKSSNPKSIPIIIG